MGHTWKVSSSPARRTRTPHATTRVVTCTVLPVRTSCRAPPLLPCLPCGSAPLKDLPHAPAVVEAAGSRSACAVRLNSVCWLHLAATFPGVLPGTYLAQCRLKCLPNFYVDELTVTVSPCRSHSQSGCEQPSEALSSTCAWWAPTQPSMMCALHPAPPHPALRQPCPRLSTTDTANSPVATSVKGLRARLAH